MENWEFKRVKFSEDSYRRDVENLNAYEYRYYCLLQNNESYVIRIYITSKYTKFFFNLQSLGNKDENVILHEPRLAYSVDILENGSQELRLGFVLRYLKGIFPSFKFDENLEL
jgi:hypothetical protein